MISLIWKYYSDPVTVVPNKWIAPLERLVAFPSGVAGIQLLHCFWFSSFKKELKSKNTMKYSWFNSTLTNHKTLQGQYTSKLT